MYRSEVFHFGAIFNDMMVMNEIGRTASDEWDKLPMRFPQLELGPFCVMPNQIHRIIQITTATSSPSPSPTTTDESNQKTKRPVILGNIVGAYKSLVMKELMDKAKEAGTESGIAPVVGKIWQRDYYEHIIRSEESNNKIAAYILTNPQNWTRDKFYQIFE